MVIRALVAIWMAIWMAMTVAACGDDPTSVELEVTYDAAWMLERLEVTIGTNRAMTDVSRDVKLLLPDDLAGQKVLVAVDGLKGGVVYAHGEVEVTPVEGEAVTAKITLAPRVDTTCDMNAADQCTDVPDPACISPTTLRISTGPGTCTNNTCSYPYSDTVCPRGCANGMCVCDDLTAAAPAIIDAPTVTVDRVFKVNGQPVTNTVLNGYGQLFLRNTATGDEVDLGYTHNGTFPVRVVSGTYDVYYELSQQGSGSGGAAVVPRNERARIAAGVSITSTMTLDLNVTVVVADRTFRVNGALVPDTSGNGYGALFLRNLTTSDEVEWGSTYQASAPRPIIAGSYEVFYEYTTGGTGAGNVQVVPRNTNARVATGVSITTTTPVAIDVPVVKPTRTFRVNGATVTSTTANGYGALYLVNGGSGDEVAWGQTYESTTAPHIIAGTYDVIYRWQSTGSGAGGAVLVPANERARIVPAASITTSAAIDLPVTTVRADRTFRVNGSAVTDTSVNGYGALFLRNPSVGDEIAWGYTYQASSQPTVIAGTYDVYYEVMSPGSGAGGAVVVPRNQRVRVVAAASITSTTPLDISVTAVTLDRVFKVNNALLTETTVNGYGQLFIRNGATGDEVDWGYTYDNMNPTTVVAGSYDVFYEMLQMGTGIGGAPRAPFNSNARIATNASFTTTTPMMFDVKVVTVDRSFRVNGAAVPDTTVNGYGDLHLRHAPTGDEILWGATYQASRTVPVIAGNYDVAYEVTQPGSGAGGATTVPRNENALLTCEAIK